MKGNIGKNALASIISNIAAIFILEYFFTIFLASAIFMCNT